MYDPSSEAREFVGHDRAEALAKATAFFGVSEDQLAIAVPEEGQIAGLGMRSVLVAYPRSAGPPRRGGDGGGVPEPRRGRSEGRGRDDDRGRGGRGGPRDRDGGRGRGGRGEGRGESRGRERGDRDREREPRVAAAPMEPEAPSGPSVGSATTALGEVGEFVKGLIERMEIGSFEIAESSESDELVILQVRGAAAERLAGGEGRSVDAMQLLANQASLRISGDDAKRVVLDVEGDDEQREAYLSRVAERAASRARETGRPVALEAMNPKDRRIVHVALREVDGIATMSVGEGRYRQVVVVPDSAPEFEEAKRYEHHSNREQRD
jgi:predicted RNA-binding protein Jag